MLAATELAGSMGALQPPPLAAAAAFRPALRTATPLRHAEPCCLLDWSAPAQMIADAVGEMVPAAPAAIDALDLVLISPLLVPFFGIWALSATGNSAGALIEKAKAESDREAANKQVAEVKKRLAAAEKKTADAEANTKRKIKFWEGKLDKQRSEALSLLRSTKVTRSCRGRVRLLWPRSRAVAAFAAWPCAHCGLRSSLSHTQTRHRMRSRRTLRRPRRGRPPRMTR